MHLLPKTECLNEEWSVSLAHARAVIENWRIHYNTARPEPDLGYRTPEAWLETRPASLELRKGSAQLPLSPMIETENTQTTWP